MFASELSAAVSLPDPLLASSSVPAWVWAALIMAAFVGLSVLTMVLIRFPALRTPPPLAMPREPGDEVGGREEDASERQTTPGKQEESARGR